MTDEIQNKIEIISGNAIQDSEREAFETSFYKGILQEKKKILQRTHILSNHTNENVTLSNNAQTQNDSVQGNVKLPNLSLPDFYGSYNQWLTFHDTFHSLINSYAHLSNTQKFFYHLKSCLKGDASNLVQSIEISNNNYDIAW